MSEELKINIPVFNENEEAELENKLLFHLDEFTSEIMKTMTKDKDIIILKKVIERQQKEIEEKSTIILAGAEKVKQLEKEIEEYQKCFEDIERHQKNQMQMQKNLWKILKGEKNNE